MSDQTPSNVKKSRRGSRGKGKRSNVQDKETGVPQSTLETPENILKKKTIKSKTATNNESVSTESYAQVLVPKIDEEHYESVEETSKDSSQKKIKSKTATNIESDNMELLAKVEAVKINVDYSESVIESCKTTPQKKATKAKVTANSRSISVDLSCTQKTDDLHSQLSSETFKNRSKKKANKTKISVNTESVNVESCPQIIDMNELLLQSFKNTPKKKAFKHKTFVNSEVMTPELNAHFISPKDVESHPNHVSSRSKKQKRVQEPLQTFERYETPRLRNKSKPTYKTTKLHIKNMPKLKASAKINRRIKHTEIYEKNEKTYKFKTKVSPSFQSSIESCTRDLVKLNISPKANKRPKYLNQQKSTNEKNAETELESDVKIKYKSKTKIYFNSQHNKIESCDKDFSKSAFSFKKNTKSRFSVAEKSDNFEDTEIEPNTAKQTQNKLKTSKGNINVSTKVTISDKVKKDSMTLLEESADTDKDAAGSSNLEVSVYDKINLCLQNIETVKKSFRKHKEIRHFKEIDKKQGKHISMDGNSDVLSNSNNAALPTHSGTNKQIYYNKHWKAKQSVEKYNDEAAEIYSDDDTPPVEEVPCKPISKKDKRKLEKKKREKDKLRHKKHFQEEIEDNESEYILLDQIQNTENSPSKKNKNMKKSNKSKLKEVFPDHMPLEEVIEILENQDPNDMKYIKGNFRINPKFYKHGYLTLSDGGPDLLIVGLRDRNRAFEGDLVVAQVKPEEEWHTLSNGDKQKTGVVVCILDEVHPREAVGQLKQQGSLIFLQPRDQRIPLIRIFPESLSKLYNTEPLSFKDTLFLAKIVNWKFPQAAVGKLKEAIGIAGDIESESRAILIGNGLDVTPYSSELMVGLPSSYILTPTDIANREDWRNACIFTIDPETATDLDDAVSYRMLSNGNYEIGIHISDVTHYLEYQSPLDIEVSKRATTVYVADNVYHMLPRELCEACSLLPGQDKLAFSVIVEMSPDAQVVQRRFVKTVINSCCQLSYDKAQMMIDEPKKNWPDDFLSIKGNFKASEISNVVNGLYELSVKMRHKIFADGALRIDQPKLHIVFDRQLQQPVSFYVEERKEANNLIEEFMLLANMEVASYLYNTIPDTALLRRHKKPSNYMLTATKNMLHMFGIHLDIETAGSLQDSIKRYEAIPESELEELKHIIKYRMMVINNLCSRTMTCAEYKCSSSVRNEDDLRHYALNVSLYTHFTSPIRRYPDCVVHRLLHAVIENKSLDNWNSAVCAKIANNCTKKKYYAKIAQEQSNELYFTYLVQMKGPIRDVAVVLDVKNSYIDVIPCNVGIKLRIYLKTLENRATFRYSTDFSVPTISILWNDTAATQIISVFSILYVQIEKHPTALRLVGTILSP